MTLKVPSKIDQDIEVLIHAGEESENSPIELEKVASPAEGVFVMDHEDYSGPEITATFVSKDEVNEEKETSMELNLNNYEKYALKEAVKYAKKEMLWSPEGEKGIESLRKKLREKEKVDG